MEASIAQAWVFHFLLVLCIVYPRPFVVCIVLIVVVGSRPASSFTDPTEEGNSVLYLHGPHNFRWAIVLKFKWDTGAIVTLASTPTFFSKNESKIQKIRKIPTNNLLKNQHRFVNAHYMLSMDKWIESGFKRDNHNLHLYSRKSIV